MSKQDKLSKKQLDEFKDAFSLFDRDGDGAVTAKEIKTVMKNLGRNPSDQELKDIMSEVDSDGSGSIDFDEFLIMMTKMMELNIGEGGSDHSEAFNLLESTVASGISVDDLKSILQQCGERLSDREIRLILQEADPDSKGKVSYEQFCSVFMFG